VTILPRAFALLAASAACGALAQGNALNPAPPNPTTAGQWMDDDGLGTRIPAARTPTGQLYNIPLDPDGEADAKRATWQASGFAELGGLHVFGDSRSAGFLQYKDVGNGLYLNSFGVSADQPSQARFFEATGGGVGRADQFYRLQYGRYNDWKVTAFYDGTPQVFTTTYRSLWHGEGTANATLASLAPGGGANAAATQAAIQAALAATPESELEAVRRKAGVRIDKRLTASWNLFAGFTGEKRTGARPFGAVFGGGGGGGNVEIAEALDYETRDFVAGAQYRDPVSSFSLRATASFFRNDTGVMTFENPLFVTLNGTSGLAPSLFTQGRIDLPPDNQHYNVKAEYARVLPSFYRGNFTAAVALGSMRQDDDLLAPTQLPLTGGTVTAGGAPLANAWNTTDALGRTSAKARIDTVLADLGLVLRPASGLDVRAKLRYYETDNSMQYQACNPLTGQWGRLLNDGSGLSVVTANTLASAPGTSANAFNAAGCNVAAARALGLVPSAGNIPIASVPYEYRQVNSSLAADYRVGRASSVEAALERESFRRAFRERDDTWEDKARIGYVNRGAIEGTIRASYELARRRGGDYDTNPYENFYSASLGILPAADTVATSSWFRTIGQFRSFDLADRDQGTLKARVDKAITPNMDGAFTLQLKDASYPAEYGRAGHQRTHSATLDLSYQAGSNAVVYGFYSYQGGSLEQKGVQPNACVIGSTYYFYSDGRVLAATTGAAAPATPAGTTLVGLQSVTGGGWLSACAQASPTSPLFPDSRAWDVAARDRNDVFGFGGKYDFGRAKLDATFTRAISRTRIGYAYNAAALGMSAVQAGLAGDRMPDLVFAQNVLQASLAVPVSKELLVRVLVRHESGRIRDWHYDGVAANPMPASNAVYLDAGPVDYRATLVGLLFHVRL
jgi:hypothetical protein